MESNGQFHGSAQPRVSVWCVGNAVLLKESQLLSLLTALLDIAATFFVPLTLNREQVSVAPF